MPVRHVQTNFNGGELSQRLQARSDIAIYPQGAAEIVNMVPTIEGALLKRSGTRYRAAAKASASWLSAFVFNASQSYILEWSDGKLRFVTNNALVLSGGVPLEIAVPYAANEASRVSMQQSGDVTYMAHEAHPHAELRRTSATNFTYAPLQLKGGPFADNNDNEAIVVGASGTTGLVTIVASAPIFEPGHVGGYFRVEANDFSDVEAWMSDIDGHVYGVKRRSEGKVYMVDNAGSGRSGPVTPTHTQGSEWDGTTTGKDINAKGPFGVRWRYLHDRFGILKITGYVSPTEITGLVERRLPDSVVATPTHRWAHSLFSSAEGWPHLVALFRGRLWFFKGFDLVGSVAGSYRDFNEYNEAGEPTDDMAIHLRLDIPDKPLWVRADRQNMVIGTALGEYAIGPVNTAEGISAKNLQVIPQSAHGSSEVWPQRTATEILFVQRGDRKVRSAAYDYGQDRYIAPNLTLWARQIGQPGIIQLAYQAESEELLWALRADGICAAHPYAPQQEVKGWARTLSMEGATIKSIAAMPSPDKGRRDDLWLLVERDGIKSLEQLADWWDEDDRKLGIEAFFVDSGLTYRGAPVAVLSGLNHLVGREVMILADGAEQPMQVVNPSGQIELEVAGSVVHVGLPFTARCKTLQPEVTMQNGSSQGRRRRLVSMVMSVLASFGLRAGSPGGKLDQVIDRAQGDKMDHGPSLHDGWTGSRAIGGGYESLGQAELSDRSPFPWMLRATVAEVEIGDR